MKTIYFIRHAQSQANAAFRTSNDAAIQLTEAGKIQAKEIAESVNSQPDHIICSPYLRARQTATPLIEKCPGIPVTISPIQEFTYLSPQICARTTANQRKNWVFNYWEQAGPDFIHGDGAESFNQFLQRINEFLLELETIAGRNIYVFTHGYVIRAVWQQLSGLEFSCASRQMQHFYHNMGYLPVPNGCIFRANFHNNHWQIVEPQLPDKCLKKN